VSEVIELHTPKPAALSWVEQAGKEIAELEAAAKADPKEFFGNHVRGMGAGLSRVKALLPAVKNLEAALNQLNRVL
jgi:hypothetical protein